MRADVHDGIFFREETGVSGGRYPEEGECFTFIGAGRLPVTTLTFVCIGSSLKPDNANYVWL